jgi:hypothetical protein
MGSWRGTLEIDVDESEAMVAARAKEIELVAAPGRQSIKE